MAIFEFIKIENKNQEKLDLTSAINEEYICNIKEFTISRIFDFSSEKMYVTLQLDKNTLSKLTGAIKKFQVEEVDEKGQSKNIKKYYLDTALYAPDLAYTFWNFSSNILLFNDFTA